MNELLRTTFDVSTSATVIRCGTLLALAGMVLLYSWKTGNIPRLETEKFSLGFQASNEKEPTAVIY